MKNLLLCLALSCGITLLTLTPSLSQTAWKPGKASVTFKIKNAGLTVNGSFGGFAGTLLFDPARPETGKLTATVETATLDTGVGMRDGHLKKEDYFNVTTYPRISLTSISIEKKGGDGYVGIFDLTLKGTTRRITMPFTFTQTDNSGTFAGGFDINRLDYKVGKSNLFLSDKLIINLSVQAQAQAVAAN